ncbi:Aa3 type cytochrome c oxidase subunit IV [Sphingomonas antarctica]
MTDEQIDISKTDARAGSAPRVTRYVLAISMALVIVAFAVIVVFELR